MTFADTCFTETGRVELSVTRGERDGCSRAHVHHAAKRLARMLQYRYVESHDDQAEGHAYVVADHALTITEAARLRVRSERDLYGGVVPSAFVATRAVTHPPISPDATVPRGWSYAFARMLAGRVLRGYAAFTHADALEAARLLLRSGPVRVSGADGAAQGAACERLDECAWALEHIALVDMAKRGVVVEQALRAEQVHVVGSARLGGQSISYVGLRRRACGSQAGCDLVIVPGDFAALDRVGLDDRARAAVVHAAYFDAALVQAYPPAFASRRSYDVVNGFDAFDRPRMGVRGPAWHCTTESPAEIAALMAFRGIRGLSRLRASIHEAEGAEAVPKDSIVYDRAGDAGHACTRYCTLGLQAA